MARQPNPNQIQEAPLRPSLSAPQINIGVAKETGSAGRAMGAAISDLGNAFAGIAAKSAATADRTNDARYNLELSKADQEIRNDIAQNTGEDGSGWEAYPERFAQRAAELNEKYPVGDNRRQIRREITT